MIKVDVDRQSLLKEERMKELDLLWRAVKSKILSAK